MCALPSRTHIARRNSSVIEGAIKPAIRLKSLIDHRLDLGRLRHIRLDEDRFAISFFNQANGLFTTGAVHMIDGGFAG